ncbi:fibrobacter succinogenes major paralogous domain-containing protein [Fibrobacter sp.]|uniref:fibrobacter succinogenes major paralogous domain-containing protein n=1 Tax=Fibrobacter sp. TaxID=35828 RepID=UPI00386D65AB
MKNGVVLLAFLGVFIAACSEDSPTETIDPVEGFTLGSMTDSRDGQTYKTVTIGSQTWMAENLNFAYTGVPFYNGAYASDSTSWCYYNAKNNCDIYGRLYTWSAAMDSAGIVSLENGAVACGVGSMCKPNSPHRGICPEGWHVPTQSEFDVLYKLIGGKSTAGTKLKTTSGWDEEKNGIDAFGFGLLPAGFRYYGGPYMGMGERGVLWSVSENDINLTLAQFFLLENT